MSTIGRLNAALGLALVLLTVALSTSFVSAACNPPKFASTYNPATAEYVYWTTRFTDFPTLQGRVWSGATDYTGTCNDGAQTFFDFGTSSGSIGLSLSLGNACVPPGLCPSGSLTVEAITANSSGTDEQILLVKVPETPTGGVNFDYSTVAYNLCDHPRPVITDLHSNGTTKIASVSIGSMTACAFGGALQDITGWNVLSKASSSDPGVFGSYGLRGSFAVTPGSDGSASGTIQLDCSNPTLDQWVTAQLVTVAPVHHVFGPTTRVSCRPASASCSGVPDGTTCDDGNACTFHDTCHGGSCVAGTLGTECDDGNACTLGDTCSAGVCHPGAGTPNCEDNNVCTTDSCDPTVGCVHPPNSNPCDDGNLCTTNDTCSGGVCHPGAPLVCTDNNLCTPDACDPAVGCVFTDPSTACDDGNPCTTDLCVPASGCGHTTLADGAACTFGTTCSVGDTCHAGVCLAPASFVSAAGAPVGPNPSSAAVGDFNRDGLIDLVVPNQGGNSVTILLGNGAGGFTQASGSPIAVGNSPHSVAAADLDRDGALDLVVVNALGNDLSVLRGNGSGQFSPAPGSPVTVGVQPVSVAVGDFKRNGRLDIAVANFGSNNVTILDQGPSGTFSPVGPAIAVGTQPAFVAAGDLNGDGTLDLVVVNSGSNDVTILLGNGSGSFTPAPGSAVASGGTSPSSVALADVDGDGKLDLALANSGSNTATILFGDGTGRFNQPGSAIGVGSTPLFIAAGDLNADGRPDLAVANSTSNGVTILLGLGAGAFAPAAGSPFTTGLRPVFAAASDLNGDGKLDLAVVNGDSNDVRVLMNDTIVRQNGGACEDGSSCTVNDACFNGSCAGTPSSCVAQCTMPPSGLTGFWPGDGLANDISSTGNHGTLMNGTTFDAGIVGQAFSLDGVDDYVRVPYSASLVPGAGSFSVGAWIRANSGGGGSIVTMNECGGSCASGFSFFVLETKTTGFGTASFSLSDSTGPGLDAIDLGTHLHDGAWHLVVATRDMTASTMSLFVDDRAPFTKTLNRFADGPIQDASGDDPVIIGAEVDNYGTTLHGFFRGLIDEVMYANRAFTPAEVHALYAAGSPRLCRCVDADGDGYGAVGGITCPNGTQQDCDDSPGHGGVWSAPIEVRNLKLGRALVDTAIRWDAQAATVGPDVTYDVIRGDLSSLAAGYSGSCIGSGITIATMTDSTAPAAGTGFWYLVRGHDSCGVGSFGNQGIHGVTGAERVSSVACP